MLKDGLECTKTETFSSKKCVKISTKSKLVQIQIIDIAKISPSHLKYKCIKMEPW